ncbi:MAG: ParB/RepB/Spo0J family partition protein [Acidimicrobiia bacterium]|nr:ParB/RepB/Spo0J family partition protein [Acidimicrobiia bacterium]MDH3470765.1 ParB/RepB/Spo0J family partition protein [Acidimicrobiia bacterium]
MAAKKPGLGKGLESLIPVERPDRGYTVVPLDRISPNPQQPRSHFDDDALEGMAASIREVGVLQPIVVRGDGDTGYVLVAGERRWRAARMAGLDEIAVVVREGEDVSNLTEALIENIQREDLTPLEEAAAYRQLLDDYGLTHEQASSRVGKSRSALTNSLRLLTLPPSVQGLLDRGELSAGHGRALAGLEDAKYATYIAERAVDEGWSVRQVEDAVRSRMGASDDVAKPRRTRRSRPAEVLELEARLAEHLATPVKIDYGARGGKLTIRFRDLNSLEEIYRRLMG